MRYIMLLAVVFSLVGGRVDDHRATGVSAQTTPVGPWPTALALDQRTGHAFVLNSGNNTVSVIDARTGALVHTAVVGAFPGALVQSGYTRAIAVNSRGGRVFIGTYGRNSGGGITTLDAATGQVVGATAVAASPSGMLVDEQANRLFVSSDAVVATNLVSVLDATSGALLHTVTFDQGVRMVAVAANGARVVAASEAAVNLLDPRTGALLHTVGAPALRGHLSSIAVNNRAGRIFVASWGGASDVPLNRISMLDAMSGALLASVPTLLPQDITINERLNRVYATVSAYSSRGQVIVLDATSGRLIGATTVGRAPGQVVTDGSTGHAFVVNGQDGTVSMLDGYSGKLLTTIMLRPALTQGIVDVEGTLSHLIAIDEQAGRVLVGNPSPYRIPHQPCPGSCPAPQPVVTGPGSVSVLDAATGRVLRTVTVERVPLALALDQSAGRGVVLNADAIGARSSRGSVSTFDVAP